MSQGAASPDVAGHSSGATAAAASTPPLGSTDAASSAGGTGSLDGASSTAVASAETAVASADSRRPAADASPAEDVRGDEVRGDDEVIRRALLWSLAAAGGVAVVVTMAVLWFRRGDPPPPEHRTELQQSAKQKAAAKQKALDSLPIPHVPFKDMTRAAGIDFVHTNGAEGERLFPEFMGCACVMFDYDGDGDLDLFFTNATHWPWSKKAAERTTSALYRNDGNWKFTNVTQEAGLDLSYYMMGAAAGDYDNDGDPDLFICAVGPSHLYRNDGGRFVDVTDVAGVGGDPKDFSTACGWFDYNHDGKLDLLVANYIIWSRELNTQHIFRHDAGVRGNLNPQAFQGTLFRLHRNEGNGLFSDVSEAAGIHVRNPKTGQPLGKGMGIVFTDLNGDHWVDMLVANDTSRNFAYLNQRNGTFREMAEKIGVGFGLSGMARSGMGIDIADFRRDGTAGVAIGNFSLEMAALFTSQQKINRQISEDSLGFTDEAIPCGIGEPTADKLTFGVVFFDYDLDGRPDLLLANGHVDTLIDQVEGGQSYAQPPQLFWNCHGLTPPEFAVDFVPTRPEHCGEDLFRPQVGRAAAVGDLDGDGDLDIVFTANGGPARLLRNDQQLGHHWLRLKLIGKRASRDAVGTLVEVTAGGRTQRQHHSPTRSYFSQCDPVLTFGLGQETKLERVRIVWPGGQEQVLGAAGVDRTLTVEQAD
jgi:hypothetical protein